MGQSAAHSRASRGPPRKPGPQGRNSFSSAQLPEPGVGSACASSSGGFPPIPADFCISAMDDGRACGLSISTTDNSSTCGDIAAGGDPRTCHDDGRRCESLLCSLRAAAAAHSAAASRIDQRPSRSSCLLMALVRESDVGRCESSGKRLLTVPALCPPRFVALSRHVGAVGMYSLLEFVICSGCDSGTGVCACYLPTGGSAPSTTRVETTCL